MNNLVWPFICKSCGIQIYVKKPVFILSRECILDCPVCQNTLKLVTFNPCRLKNNCFKESDVMENKLYAVEISELEIETNNQTKETKTKKGMGAIGMTVETDENEATNYIRDLMALTTNCDLWEVTNCYCADDIQLYQENCENAQLFGVKVFQVPKDDKEQILDKKFFFVIGDEVKNAQQLAIKHMQKKTNDDRWNVAEGTPIENVEGWLVNPQKKEGKWCVKLESTSKLDNFNKLKTAKKAEIAEKIIK
jgi:hypothetical protein